jgi:hypothetical protein
MRRLQLATTGAVCCIVLGLIGAHGDAVAQSGQTLTLTPSSATLATGKQHTVTATLANNGDPIPGATIRFAVTGANKASDEATTNSSGQAKFTYTGTEVGNDTIHACRVFEISCSEPTATASASWTEPALSINNTSVNEGATASFIVTLSPASPNTVTVQYATANCGTNQAAAGSDYTSVASTQLTFTPNQTSKTVMVSTLQDTTDEANETFCVILSNASNATISDNSGQATIVDDDAAAVSISDGNAVEGASASFAVSLSAASASTVSVTYSTASGTATSGSDFPGVPATTLTFSPGQTTKQVSVLTLQDVLDEPTETFVVNLSNPTNATIADGQGVGTILDDDGAPTLAINDVSVTEGNAGTTNAVFTVIVEGAHQGVSVGYATANGSGLEPGDYTSTGGTLTIPGGAGSGTIGVPVVGDTTVEPNEHFAVNLSSPNGAEIVDGNGVGTILNDDAPTTMPPPAQTSPPPPPQAPGPPPVEIGDPARDPLPDDLPERTAAVSVNLNGDGAVTSSSPTQSLAADVARIRCVAPRFACQSRVEPGTRLLLTARPDPGFAFRGWTGACSGQGVRCTLSAGSDRSVTANFAPQAGTATVAMSVRPARVAIFWVRSVGTGRLVLRGLVGRDARVRIDLRRPGGGPLLSRMLTLRGGFFQARLNLRPGTLRRSARLFPGGFVVSLRGRAGPARVPLQVQTFSLASPPEGVVRSSFVTPSQTGQRTLRLPAGAREAFAHFRFHTQPRANLPLSVWWFRPDGSLLGSVQKSNRPEVFSFVRTNGTLTTGAWVAELRAGNRIVQRLSVRIGV